MCAPPSSCSALRWLATVSWVGRCVRRGMSLRCMVGIIGGYSVGRYPGFVTTWPERETW